MKKILILGATSTIAQEIAKIYAKENAHIFLVGRNQQQLEIQRDDLNVRGAKDVKTLAVDLNDLARHAEITATVFRELVSIDVVVLAHGVLGDQNKALTSQQEFLNIIQSNFVSHASLLLTLTNEAKQRRNLPTIAVLSSAAGDRGKQSNFIYGSAMAAKTAFADGLRNKLFSDGIHIVTVKLGFVDTAMTKAFKKGPLWAQAPSIAKSIVIAIDKKKDNIYLPFFWRFIMLIIKNIPESIFKKLKL